MKSGLWRISPTTYALVLGIGNGPIELSTPSVFHLRISEASDKTRSEECICLASDPSRSRWSFYSSVSLWHRPTELSQTQRRRVLGGHGRPQVEPTRLQLARAEVSGIRLLAMTDRTATSASGSPRPQLGEGRMWRLAARMTASVRRQLVLAPLLSFLLRRERGLQ
jgi:hypothetical protein